MIAANDSALPTRPARVASSRTARSFRGAETWIAQARIDTPLGPMSAVTTLHGLAGLWFDGQSHHPGAIAAPLIDDHPLFDAVRAQLQDYWTHPTKGFNLPLDPQGTAFQRQVWDILQMIPVGRTITYGDIAHSLDQPTASRAVGAAVGRNPISLIVPCHRVVGQQGALTGYAGGLARKTALLRLEGETEATGGTLL